MTRTFCATSRASSGLVLRTPRRCFDSETGRYIVAFDDEDISCGRLLRIPRWRFDSDMGRHTVCLRRRGYELWSLAVNTPPVLRQRYGPLYSLPLTMWI